MFPRRVQGLRVRLAGTELDLKFGVLFDEASTAWKVIRGEILDGPEPAELAQHEDSLTMPGFRAGKTQGFLLADRDVPRGQVSGT